MPFHPHKHHRKSIRLKGYDYSQAGLYFIAMCVQNRECLFGKVENHEMILNDAGQMIEHQWEILPQRFKNVQLHESTVMPNHFHGILEIAGVEATLVVAQNDTGHQSGQPQGLTQPIPPTEQPELPGQPQGVDPTGQPQGFDPTSKKTVGDMMDAFKSITTVEYIRGVKNLGWKPFNRRLWQRNYYEHIIRNELAIQRISRYIANNPPKWDDDKFYK